MAFTQAGGVRIAYDARGHGDAIVFVHDFGADRRVWAPQLAELGQSYRAIALDLRGHGESGPVEVAIAEHHALDINAVLDAERVARAHVVGLGRGGEAALRLALDFPARVRSLTLVGRPSPEAEGALSRVQAPTQRLLAEADAEVLSRKLAAVLAELRS